MFGKGVDLIMTPVVVNFINFTGPAGQVKSEIQVEIETISREMGIGPTASKSGNYVTMGEQMNAAFTLAFDKNGAGPDWWSVPTASGFASTYGFKLPSSDDIASREAWRKYVPTFVESVRPHLEAAVRRFSEQDLTIRDIMREGLNTVSPPALVSMGLLTYDTAFDLSNALRAVYRTRLNPYTFFSAEKRILAALYGIGVSLGLLKLADVLSYLPLHYRFAVMTLVGSALVISPFAYLIFRYLPTSGPANGVLHENYHGILKRADFAYKAGRGRDWLLGS